MCEKNNISYVKKSPLGSGRISLQLRLQEAESNQNHFEKGKLKSRPASKWQDEMQFPLQGKIEAEMGLSPGAICSSLLYIRCD